LLGVLFIFSGLAFVWSIRMEENTNNYFVDEAARLKELTAIAQGKWVLELAENDTVVDSQVQGDTLWLRVRALFPAACYDSLIDVLDVNLEKRFA
jgi:hypothetical protein